MITLQHPYLSVETSGGASCGGGQQFSDSAMIRRCGCGIVAAADLLWYLCRWHLGTKPALFSAFPDDAPVPLSDYNACIAGLNRAYFPMIPYAGINGVMLMAGIDGFLRDNHMPFSARWCFSPTRMWERTREMLRGDIPVIMSVGPNFPQIWGNKRVSFYIQTADGRYRPTAGARSHYFTVTGTDETWLRISSWGRQYYLNRWEFEEYMRRQSLRFTSNILLVKRKP